MDRVLKKYTTIPQHLYVDRGADLQLKKIIEDMQRPGYVLVARQMGKTNLLINAKRSLENNKRMFVYVDLSNLYENERDCYRNIINNTIELNLEVFEEIENRISEIRSKNLPAHNEYLRSIIAILNHYSGDLIIILDEIDALKSVEYSDNIFAQIRSNYFSRTNFEVLERLTYVLSGVIEPTELIKDKNKSPFNIGDKIYLDDFSIEEHNTFIYKSKLQITQEISNKIFDWTSGNPRLTFDICSEIESLILKGTEINDETLDKLINKKYLVSFDLAPIDHIRELVKENKFIRDAVKNIHSERYDLISDDVKNKLYLYGIINSRFQDKTKIKNRIIFEALNPEWLKSIDIEKTFFAGLSKYSDGLLVEAIEIFEHLVENSSDKIETEKSRYYLGLSYYSLDDYKEAIKYFSFNYDNLAIKNDADSYYGICLLKDGNKSGLEILEKAILLETHNYPYHAALLNLAINTTDKEKALSLLEKLIISTYKSKDKEEDLNDLRAVSYFYQSNIYEFLKNIPLALEKIDNSLQFVSKDDKPILLYYKILLKLKNKDTASDLRNELVEAIIDGKLKFSNRSDYPLVFDIDGIKEIINTIFDSFEYYPFVKLLDYISSNLIKNKKDSLDLAIQSSQITNTNSDQILQFIKTNYSTELTISQEIDICRLISDTEKDDTKYFKKFNEYFDLLINNIDYDLIEDDLGTLVHTVQKYISLAMFNPAIKICDFTGNRIENSNNEILKHYLTYIAFWRTNIFFLQGNKNETLKSAQQTLEIVKNVQDYKNNKIDASTLTTITQNINKIIDQVSRKPITTNSSLKSLGNQIVKVRYQNGKVYERKFKHVENDIKMGRCVIINQ